MQIKIEMLWNPVYELLLFKQKKYLKKINQSIVLQKTCYIGSAKFIQWFEA